MDRWHLGAGRNYKARFQFGPELGERQSTERRKAQPVSERQRLQVAVFRTWQLSSSQPDRHVSRQSGRFAPGNASKERELLLGEAKRLVGDKSTPVVSLCKKAAIQLDVVL